MNRPGDLIEVEGALTPTFRFAHGYPAREVSTELCDWLFQAITERGELAIRVLLHNGAGDMDVHSMVIAQSAGHEDKVHRHTRSQTVHAITGRVNVVLTDGQPGNRREITVGSCSPIVRIAAGAWHKVVIDTPVALYHEFNAGPFDRERDNEYLDAPAESA